MTFSFAFIGRARSPAVGGAQEFPVVESVNSGTRLDLAGTTITVNMPAGVTNGDLLVCVAQIDDSQATITFPGTWTKEIHQIIATGGSGTFTVGCKVASGEGSSFDITTSGTDEAAYYIYRISGHNGYEIEGPTTGNDASPAPPAITPTWGSAKTLWIICGGADNDPYTAAPANYTTNFVAVTEPDACVGVSYRTNEAASETPGTFTISSDDWVCATIAVRPA